MLFLTGFASIRLFVHKKIAIVAYVWSLKAGIIIKRAKEEEKRKKRKIWRGKRGKGEKRRKHE